MSSIRQKRRICSSTESVQHYYSHPAEHDLMRFGGKPYGKFDKNSVYGKDENISFMDPDDFFVYDETYYFKYPYKA